MVFQFSLTDLHIIVLKFIRKSYSQVITNSTYLNEVFISVFIFDHFFRFCTAVKSANQTPVKCLKILQTVSLSFTVICFDWIDVNVDAKQTRFLSNESVYKVDFYWNARTTRTFSHVNLYYIYFGAGDPLYCNLF